MKIYFAHCMADYGAAREEAALGVLLRSGAEVVNPNSPDYQGPYILERNGPRPKRWDPMGYWTDLVLTCDQLAFLPNVDDTVGSGVAKEILEALVHGMPVYRIDIERRRLKATARIPPVLTIAETRDLIRETQNGSLSHHPDLDGLRIIMAGKVGPGDPPEGEAGGMEA